MGVRRKLTDEQIAEIVELRERGRSYAQLGSRFSVSSGAILYQCLKHGAVSPRQRRVPTPEHSTIRRLSDGRIQRTFCRADDARLLELERQGLNYGEISRTMGRAPTSVRIRLMMLAMREDLPVIGEARS